MIFPMTIRRATTRQVLSIRRHNSTAHQISLCRENHVAIQSLLRGCRQALLAGLRPQLGGTMHCFGVERQIIEKPTKVIESLDTLLGRLPFVDQVQKFSTQLVVGNFRNRNLDAFIGSV